MKITTYVLLLTALAFLSDASIADGGNFDGNQLLTGCQDAITIAEHPRNTDVDYFLAGYCAGLVNGIEGAVYSTENKKARIMCLPKEGISGIQKIRIIIKFLNLHPEGLHISGDILAVTALQRAYPCK